MKHFSFGNISTVIYLSVVTETVSKIIYYRLEEPIL